MKTYVNRTLAGSLCTPSDFTPAARPKTYVNWTLAGLYAARQIFHLQLI